MYGGLASGGLAVEGPDPEVCMLVDVFVTDVQAYKTADVINDSVREAESSVV